MAKTRVLVIGSFVDPKRWGAWGDWSSEWDEPSQRDEESEARIDLQKKYFQSACISIGNQLALNGNPIVFAIPDWRRFEAGESVITWILDGVHSAGDKSKPKVVVYQSEEVAKPDLTPDKVDTLQEIREKYGNKIDFKVKYNTASSLSYSQSLTAVRDLGSNDVMLIIGGYDDTVALGVVAHEFNKPVLVIPYFGGAGNALYQEFYSSEYRGFVEKNPRRLDNNDIDVLLSEWSDKTQAHNAQGVAKLVRLLPGLNKKHETQLSRLELILAILFSILFIVLLVIGASTKMEVAGSFAHLFTLASVGSILGTILRRILAFQYNSIAGVVGKTVDASLLRDLVIGFLLSMIFTLLYFVGGLTFTGTAVNIESLTNSSYFTISIVLAIIGIACGNINPIGQLEKALERAIQLQESDKP
jgi:hypothetical protein